MVEGGGECCNKIHLNKLLKFEYNTRQKKLNDINRLNNGFSSQDI